MLASVAWSFICAALVDRLFARVGSGWTKLTHRLCALAFIALAQGTLRDLSNSPQKLDSTKRPPIGVPVQAS